MCLETNGDLLNIDNVTDKTQADNDSIEIGLSAIDPTFRSDIISADAVGGRVDIYRGLISSTTGDLLADPLLLWEGVIFSVSLSQDHNIAIGSDVYGFTISSNVAFSTITTEPYITTI